MREQLHSRAKVGAFLACFALLVSPIGTAAEVFSGAGIAFEVPAGLVSLPGQQPPVASGWKDPRLPIVLDVILLDYDGDPADTAAEFLDPEAGRAFAEGAANSQAQRIGQELNAACTSSSASLGRDPARHAVWARMETVCSTRPAATRVRTFAVMVLTRSKIVLVSVRARTAGFSEAGKMAEGVWGTLTVDPVGLQKVGTPAA
jgi:hypothetical protein